MNNQLTHRLCAILGFLLLAGPALCGGHPFAEGKLPRIMESRSHVPVAADPAAKAITDTFSLIGPWGSGAPANGQFQDTLGQPAWNGWTSHDLTTPPENHWHVSDYREPEGNLSLYCGDELLPPCQEDDPVGGYGNNWQDSVEFRYQVPNPGTGCAMTVSGILSYSTEIGYDFLEMEFLTADGPVPVESLDGEEEDVPFNQVFSYSPGEYMGAGQDEVGFRFVFSSDPAYSDEDCLVYGSGAARVDDILVNCSNGDLSYFEDFQSGTLGQWTAPPTSGVGDFAGIWQGLEDMDPCLTNYSPQVAFIDDGTQVPGAGPSECITWCYGPGGYIVNNSGGASELEDAHLFNTIRSPIITWNGSSLDGGVLSFDVYRHEDFTANSAGMFYFWEVRSAADPNNIQNALWDSNGLFHFGPPQYIRESFDVTPFIVPGANAVQVQLGVYEIGWAWGVAGNDGTPAPYFDNVALKVFDQVGPTFRMEDYYHAQDGFPEAGTLDLENLANNHVRFDMGGTINGDFGTVPQTGDSLFVRIYPTRSGGQVEQPRIHYTIDRNPLFDAVRDPAYGPTGILDGYQYLNQSQIPVPNYFFFDLPDSGFLFPGDVIHYHFSAVETVNGMNPETATFPSDLDGYGQFQMPRRYDERFVMRALPSLGDTEGSQPEILLWDDSDGHDDPNRWYWSLRNLGFQEGIHYDRYFTKGARQGEYNGLGARCTPELLAGYRAVLYTSGDMRDDTLGADDPYNNNSPDIPLLEQWLSAGDKNLLLMGDNLVHDVDQNDPGFVQETMGLDFFAEDIRPIISEQTSPRVLAVPANMVIQDTEAWRLAGGCPDIAEFDAVVGRVGSVRLAEFTTPAGQPGYIYAAGVLHPLDSGSRVITLPFKLESLADDPDYPVEAPHHRIAVLGEILDFFMLEGGPLVPVPENGKFQLANHPNPFNPATRIDFNLPQDGRIEVRVFNLRGELVRTLLDEQRPAGPGHVMWDGKDGAGAQVGSGLYFCEARAAGAVKVQKMTLLK